MTITTLPARNSSRAAKPSNSATDTRANFARAAVFAEFGRHARALDQADFVDRMPGDPVHPSPDARLAV